jgi:hypothetical protein
VSHQFTVGQTEEIVVEGVASEGCSCDRSKVGDYYIDELLGRYSWAYPGPAPKIRLTMKVEVIEA